MPNRKPQLSGRLYALLSASAGVAKTCSQQALYVLRQTRNFQDRRLCVKSIF
jgi:hypothetical protein